MSAIAISPALVVIDPKGKAIFTPSGGTGTGYTFALSQNESRGTINPSTGAYVAGPRPVTSDIVTVIDSGSNTTSAQIAVQGGAYQRYQAGLAPPWMQDQNGSALEQQYGAEKDLELERARQGVLAKLPGLAPPDALDVIGQERQLPRATSESPSDNGGTRDQAFAERLRTCWDALSGWSFAGSHASLLYALDRAGFPMGDPNGAHIIQRYKRYSWLSASGGSPVYATLPLPWTFDASPGWMPNQFGIIFGATVSGLTPGSAAAELLNATVDTWRPRKARYMGAWMLNSGLMWGWPPGGHKWGDVGLVWGGSVTFIPPIT